MADVQNKILNTRIQLKYDTYDNWSTNNPTLLQGEIAIAILTDVTSQTGANAAGTTGQHPVLFKVGPGEFNVLPWASALAADVYAWAKAQDMVLDGQKIKFKLADGSFLKKDATNDYEIDLSIFDNSTDIGNLEELNTTAKSNLVTAINEVLTAVDAGGTGSVVTITKLATPTEGSSATYQLYQGGKPVGEKIEIPIVDIDTGVMSVSGSQAITATGDANVIVGLKLDTAGNVSLSQSDSGLKAEIDLSDYSKTVSVKKEETSAEGIQTTYKVYAGDTAVDVAIEIPESTKVEDSEQNGYLKVDGEEVMVFNDKFDSNGQKTVVTAGGIAAGSEVDGKTIQQILYNMMFPYQKPTVTATATPNGGTYEKGNTQTITNVKAVVTKKTENITKVELFNGSTSVEAKTGDEVKDGGTFNFAVNREVSSNGGTYTVKVSDGINTVSANTGSFSFIAPFYYGVCAANATIDEALVKGLTKDLSAKGTKTYNYTTNSQRMVIAYPTSYGDLKTIKDGNGLDNLGAFANKTTVSITNAYGNTENYYVYTNGVTSVTAKMIFGF